MKTDSMWNLFRGAVRAFVFIAVGSAAFVVSYATFAHNTKIPIVAAENFYGDIVRQIGGEYVKVTSVLNNPDEDPHLFEASPKTARALHHARIVIYNGADYDPWMPKLLNVSKNDKRRIIIVAKLVGKKSGDNPHLWYDPATMSAVARAISSALSEVNPSRKNMYDANLTKFLDSLKPVNYKIAAMRERYSGLPVTATEPVFGYMSDAIGFTMRNQRFQLATMNNTEASASDIVAFERDLRERRVCALIYNSQATDALTKHMLKLAQDSHVPIVSVIETQPADKTWQQWMLAQLDILDKVLATNKSANAVKGKTQ